MQISCHSNSRARQSRQLPFHLSSQPCIQPWTSSAGVWLFPFKGPVKNWGNYSIDSGLRRRKRGRQSCGKGAQKEHVAHAWWEGVTQVNWDYSSKNKQASKGHICCNQSEKQNYTLYFFCGLSGTATVSCLISLQNSSKIFTFWLPCLRQSWTCSTLRGELVRTSGWEHADRQDFATQEHLMCVL